jgi:dTDP-4-amino-4,6-dideoxygalactose transaminase
VSAYTWLATASAVLAVGGIPVLTEVDESLAMDPADVERKMGPRVKAIVPVHMIGRPADLETLTAIARKHRVKLLEDSCQMVGGSYKGRRTGSWGDAGAFSLNFFKIISTGEGGALVTSDRTIYERAFIFHDSGSAFRPKASELAEPIFVAQQYRADEIMGAVARMQLQRMDGIIADLRRRARRIERNLQGARGVRVAPNNDFEGDAGVCVALRFDSEEPARRFSEMSVVSGYLGINHGKHVYTNWTPIVEKRIMHHPAMNPFNFAANKGARANYGPDACPRTLDLLRRTFFVQVNPDWSDADTEAVAEKIIDAGRKL